MTEKLYTQPQPADRYRRQSDPLLQLDKVNVSFDGFRALTDLSLQIGVSELRCVTGPNGAGKTILMDVITGKTRPDSGQIIYDQDTDLSIMSPVAITRAGIGRKFQKPTVFEALTVFENLEIALKNDKSVRACLRARLNAEQRDRIDETLKLHRLGGARQRRAGQLSHGQKQQLAIGRALVSKPGLLILDEPTEGIQPSIIKETGEVIRQLAQQGDMAILLVEQFYDFTAALADQYLVMSRGEIIRRGKGEDMQQDAVRNLVAI